jgi:hypothetical protein
MRRKRKTDQAPQRKREGERRKENPQYRLKDLCSFAG